MDRREYVSAHLDVSPGSEKRLETPSSDTPFRIVLLGDFSGRGNRGMAAEPRLRGRKAIAVDFDNYEDVMARMRPQLELPGPDEPIRLQFTSLDDFHPEGLYETVPLFRELRAQQDALLESPTRPRRPAPAPAAPAPVPEMLDSGSLLDDILGGVETPSPARQRPRDAFSQHIHEIVSPHLQAAPGAQQQELAAQVEDTIALAMRVILHHPEFQDLEAAWRSVDFVMRRIELGGDLQLHLIDLSKKELMDDLARSDDLSSTGLHRLLVEEAWAALRGSPEASWIGASLPRFMLRDPYTKDSVDAFRFEEMDTPPAHSDYLWANPAVAIACLVGDSFSQDGWNIGLRNTVIGSLPVHSWKMDADVLTTPCAECWMTERTVDRFLSRGIMPLASIKHSDSVKLVRLQSIANPAAPLRARWS